MPHLNAAYNLARWLTGNEHDAQDVTQEAFLRAFRYFDSFKGGDAKGWLFEIVRNTCFTWKRREQRGAVVQFDERVHSSRDAPTEPDVDRRAILRRCIELLPQAFREILILREFEEMPYRRIAEIASLPVGTVMSRLSRARKRLEDCAAGRPLEAGE